MKSLFDIPEEDPFLSRMMPDQTDSFLGQTHLMGMGCPLKGILEAKTFRSMVIYGPPGCGKSSFVHLLQCVNAFHFEEVRGSEGTVADLKKAIDVGKDYRRSGQKTILVIEEIDRFTRNQQDVLIPALERGDVFLLGLSYENPARALLPPLVSRLLVFPFYPLSSQDLGILLERCRLFLERDQNRKIEVDQNARTLMIRRSGGDARKLLLVFEAMVAAQGEDVPVLRIGHEGVSRFLSLPGGVARDRESHFDLISAFIKSVRNHEPDAALHYLARMIESGEDPVYVARRLIVLAAEDVGLANPAALPLAVACLEAIRSIGMPEGRIPLSETTLYLTLSPKSNSAYKAVDRAIMEVREGFLPPVPEFLKNVHLPGGTLQGKPSGNESYQYPPDIPEGISSQIYFSGRSPLYLPPLNPTGSEVDMLDRLKDWEKAKARKSETGSRTESG
ncbi:MAG: AAA family ATPase [Leptospirales bacterium]